MATLTPCRVSSFSRVSLLYITELSEHSVSNHPMNSSAPFSSLLYSGTEHLPVGIMASPLASRLAYSSSRIEFVSYGLLFHFQLLSTPHYCDAVTFGYRPGNFGRAGLSPASSVCSKAHSGSESGSESGSIASLQMTRRQQLRLRQRQKIYCLTDPPILNPKS